MTGVARCGTASGYRNRKCRCPLCVAAFLAYKERENARKVAKYHGKFDTQAKRCECGERSAWIVDGECLKCGKLAA